MAARPRPDGVTALAKMLPPDATRTRIEQAIAWGAGTVEAIVAATGCSATHADVVLRYMEALVS